MHNVVPDDKTIATYDPHIDDQQGATIRTLGDDLEDVRVAHINSTASGGGVAEIVQSLVPLLNDVGVETDWLVMDAPETFFDVTKAIHNGLQGEEIDVTDEMRETYRSVTVENAREIDTEYDVLVLHDPQTLGMAPILVDRFPETALIWRCHIDLTNAAPAFLAFVQSWLDPIDRAIFTLESYGDRLSEIETVTIHPAIDPVTEKNCPLDELSGTAADATDPDRYPVDPDRPLVVQVSRFDPWKDPIGVVNAHRMVTESIPEAQLALVGSRPDDDPEGIEVYREVTAETSDDPDVHLLTDRPDAGINYLQRTADIVLQKSLREGFALTVSEALWKETPVIGTNVGGIPLQVEDGTNGYLVEPTDIDGTADRLIRLLDDDDRRRQFGRHGKQTVREQFLLPRLVEDYLTLVADVTRSSLAA